MKLQPKTAFALSVAIALGYTATASAEAIEQRASADPNGEVEIVNVAGNVRVIGWDKAEVEVTGETEDRSQIEFATQGARTTLRVVSPRNRRGWSDGTDLIVHIPEHSALSINTTSADQTIDRVRGRQRLQSVSGSIDTEVGDEELYVKSISGDIRVLGIGSEAAAMRRVSSVSGDLTLSKIGGEIELETVSGDMHIDATELARARINTTNGDLQISTKLAQGARFDVEAVNGDVRLDLLGSIDAQFNVRTFNGDITSCFGDAKVQTREYGPGSHLDFTQGAGSGRVSIKTLNGDVELCGKAR